MPRSSRRALAVLVALAAAATTFVLPGRPAVAVANDTPDITWVANGDVHAVLAVGNRTYIGGVFDQVGPNTGSGVALDLESGAAAATIARVNGPVYAAAPDGAGGWYIGGDFTQVAGRSRHNAAFVKSDGTLGGWNPNVNYPVRSVVVDNPNRRIYLGGEFTTVRTDTQLPDGAYAKATVGGIAATKKSDGSFDAAVPLPAIGANPDPKATRFSVNAMALSADKSQLFVGGTFAAIAGIPRPGLALVDLGATPSVNAAWNPQPNGPVAALVQSADGRVVVGGAFTSVGGNTRNGLAVVAGSGAGAVDSNWGITANGPVAVLTAAHGGIYVGGSFTEMAGVSRNRLALIKTDVPSGSIESFDPGVADGDVLAITAAPSGAGIYVGGTFSTVGGVPRRYLAAVNTESRTAVAAFDARVAAPVRAVAASAVQVYAGGDFTSVGGEIRRNVAALLPDGSLDTAFRADTDGEVNALVADGASLYIGGTYKNIGPYTQREHRGLTKVDASTGAVDDAFKANIDASVYALAISGSRVYVGGNFSSVSNRGPAGSVAVPRLGGAAVNVATGAVEAWNPNPESAIRDLLLSPDQSTVYIGGDFRTVNGIARLRLAAVDPFDGALTPWAPAPPAMIHKFALSADGSKIFLALGGAYTTGNRLQAWSTVTNARLWDVAGDGDFQAVAVSSSLVYAGGHFDVLNKVEARQHLAAFDPDTGAVQPWGPAVGGVHGVLDLQVTGSHIYVAGEFDKIGNVVAQGFARFGNTGDPPPTTTTVPGAPTTTAPPTTAPPTTATTAPPTTATTAPPTTATTAPPATATTAPPGTQPAGGSDPGAATAGIKVGYWMVGSEGSVYSFGDASHLGGTVPPAGTTVVDLEPTASGKGYWMVTDRGVVTARGAAISFGAPAAGSLAPGETVTSLSATPTGRGYWIFTNKGRVMNFGDATFFGDMSKVALNGPVLDSIPTTTGRGYYMVAGDGGIFAFGDAKFFGSMGGKQLNAPVQSLVPDGDGVGYWLVASDGGIFAFQAGFKGSMGGQKLNKPVTGMVRFADGYLMVGEDGGIFNFSSRPFLGSLGGSPPARPIVSVAALG